MWGGGERGDQLHQLFSLGRNRAGKLLRLREVPVRRRAEAEPGTEPSSELPPVPAGHGRARRATR